ncbi:MAG: hypothetical protein HYX92_15860 [Chloroflexi bacterium]|nr:hypothetical protein [Chloroflexota bacterium]
MTDSSEELSRKIKEIVIESIVAGLTAPAGAAQKPPEPASGDIVFRGTLREVDDYFYGNMWTDGLPIVPPTLQEVERFLAFTERSPHEVIGALLPENREATIWNTAVNGVMAGCRPEYMPLLIAIVEAISDPEFRIEDAGSTPGWEALIILNGPIIKELDFNCGSGMMRVGRRPNSSVGRFLRLYMRNVAGLRVPPGATDKGSIGYSFNVVLAENEDAVAEIGWEPFSVDQGFQRGDNVVTVQSCVSISSPCYSGGTKPEEHMETIAEVIGKPMACWTGLSALSGRFHPLFVLSPSVAEVIAKGGWTKDDVRRYLYQKVKAPAGLLEKLTWQAGPTTFSFCQAVEENLVSKEFCQSTDPDRLIPVILRPEWVGVVVSGDPGRNQSRGYMQGHKQGPPISKRVVLPSGWEQPAQVIS